MSIHFTMLKKGAKIGVIAPSSIPNEAGAVLPKVERFIENLGFQPIIPEDVFGSDPYCANSPESRVAHIEGFINDKVDAIWALKGGYGAGQLMPTLMELKPGKKLPLLIGYSDITVLHILWQHWGAVSVHGSMLAELANDKRDEHIERLLLGDMAVMQFDLTPMNEAAQANPSLTAKVIGGNMALLQTTLGTEWQVKGKDHILLLEDIDEDTKRIDRMVHHLAHAGALDGIKALLLGGFARVPDKRDAPGIEEALKLIGSRLDVPVYRNTNIGHTNPNLPILFGHKSEIKDGQLRQVV